jgi:hypothetical protein
MIWFPRNRSLAACLIGGGLLTAGAVWFLLSAKSDSDAASIRFGKVAAEMGRLERLAPFPSGENLRKMKVHAENYAIALGKLEEELKRRAPVAAPMAPSEFQSHLRIAMTAIADKARANKVKLPDKFYLGFEEFMSALPEEAAAPSLGLELVQIEWLLNILIDAQVETLIAFHRDSPPRPGSAAAAKSAGTLPTGLRSLERNVVEAKFVSKPGAARKALNQIAGANQHFGIIRLLEVRNEKQQGPARESANQMSAMVPSSQAASSTSQSSAGTALNFIVGNERIETRARIEIVRFVF